jgi:phosphotransferase system enzyme I (PtsI)
MSVTPAAIPEVKKVCRSVTAAQCQHLAERVMALDTALAVEVYVREELKKVVPEFAA